MRTAVLMLCFHTLLTAPGAGSVRRASGLSIMIGPVIPSEIREIRKKWNTKMLALISSLLGEPVPENLCCISLVYSAHTSVPSAQEALKM